MLRKHKRQLGARPYKTVSEETIQMAIDDCNKGASQRAVCNVYGIPRSTLQNKLITLHPEKPGGQTELSAMKEKAIMERLTALFKWGFPFDSTDCRVVVKRFLDEQGRTSRIFKDNMPAVVAVTKR